MSDLIKPPFPDAHKPAMRAFLDSPAGQAFQDWASVPDVADFDPTKTPTLEAAALHGAYGAGFRKVIPSLKAEIRREKREKLTPNGPASVS